jgi:Glyoxalase-like domain
MATRVQVALDCADPQRIAEFWAAALGYILRRPPAGFDTWEAFLRAEGVPEEEWNAARSLVDPDDVGPRMFLQRVPEAKAGKNRMHLDLNVSGGPGEPEEVRRTTVAAEVDRLVGLGATKVAEMNEWGGYWVVMRDPEGNEFCVQ